MKSAGRKKENVYGFASYYTAIFGSLMSESKTSCVSGERWGKGPSERAERCMDYLQLCFTLRLSGHGCCRTGGTLFDRSSSLLTACTYTTFQGFWGLGKGLGDTYCELKMKAKACR